MESTAKRKLLADRIQALRKRAGLKQSEVAERIGIDTKSLSRIEQGRHYPSLDTLEAIGEAVHATFQDFFDFPSGDREDIRVLRECLKAYAESLSEPHIRELIEVARKLESKD